MKNWLPPVLVFGTGLTRQLLTSPEEAPDAVNETAPLTCWTALLRTVAAREGLLGVCTPALERTPTLLWEEMVRCKVESHANELGQLPAAKAETALRKCVAQVLKEATSAARPLLNQDKVKELQASVDSHLISLNFDCLLLPNDNPKDARPPAGVADSRLERLKMGDSIIWHPHGSVRNPRTIKLGLRDYGRMASDWEQRFRSFKREQRNIESEVATDRSSVHEKMLSSMRRHGEGDARAFISRILLAPLIFYGVGLSESEWGLWWILNQRARNLAQIPKPERPPTVILKRHQDPNQEFWQARPAGVAPLFCHGYNEGWRRMIDWLNEHKERSIPIDP